MTKQDAERSEEMQKCIDSRIEEVCSRICERNCCECSVGKDICSLYSPIKQGMNNLGHDFDKCMVKAVREGA